MGMAITMGYAYGPNEDGVNGMVQQLCREEEVEFVDLWDNFVGKEELKLKCRQYPAIHTNYSCSNCTISN